MIPHTLTSLFFAQSIRCAEKPVLRIKQDGQWIDISWKQLSADVNASAASLINMGIQPGDRVGILSENRAEFIIADMSILAVGGITVALHSPLSAAQVHEQFSDSAPKIVFTSTKEQYLKLLSISSSIPSIQKVVSFDNIEFPDTINFKEHLDSGTKAYALQPEAMTSRLANIRPEDIAAIIYTSGTTGESKGVMLTHNNFTSNIEACAEFYPAEKYRDLLTLIVLPLSHVYARTCDLYFGLMEDRIIALAESVDKFAQNLQEIRPQQFSAVPRIHEKFAIAARSLQEAGHKDALREILGGRILYCGSGGAALPVEIERFYWKSGIPVYQGYGLTETSPVISFNWENKYSEGTAGGLVKDVEVKIAEDGEILSRGPHIMKGYWNKPKATAEAIDSEGWFHTGDVGYMDEDGFLHITDRKKDILVNAYGKNIAPQQLEGLLCFDKYIEQACVYGDGRKFLSALIVPSAAPLLEWAKNKGLQSYSVEELTRLPEVIELFHERVHEALINLAPHEQLQKFILLPEPFSLSSGEMTVTAKLRRNHVIMRHIEELEELYKND